MPRPLLSTVFALGLAFFCLLISATPGRAADDDPAPAAATEPDVAATEDAEKAEAAGRDPLRIYERIEVKERADDLLGIADSATEGATGRGDLERRPLLRPGEVLETVPGLIATQHSGGGKANQYFLRGFNLDHGTDFRITVGDMQVNLPTHGHGQGYADLSFLIPELVDSVRFKKGPYYADEGDFSAAGAGDIDYVYSLPEGIVEATGGSFGYGRALVADSFSRGGGTLLAALEASHNDGPWERDDDFQRWNGLLRYSRGDTARGYSWTLMGYDGSWEATDQVPRRAVRSGLIGRFGLIDPDLGGASSRYSLSGERHRGSDTTFTRWSAYLLYYDLELLSNFTYFLEDPENGDEFLQLDRRLASGLKFNHQWMSRWAGRTVESSAGLQLRADAIDNGLFGARGGVAIQATREDEVFQVTGGPFVESLVHWSDHLRTRLGLRADYYHADVTSNLEANSGTRDDVLLSPKLSFIFGPWKATELYLNLGYGHHSNDARGATIRVDPGSGEPIDRVEPLVRARGADVGVRTQLFRGLTTSLSLFALELDSELVFVGDAGGTEASRPSRRLGVEWANFYRLTDWLLLDLDVALTRPRFTDQDPVGDRIPGAIEGVVAAGVSVEDVHGFFGSLRLRYFRPAALVEDNSVRSDSSALVNARLGYELRNGLRLALEVFNVFDREDSDIQYFYASRLPGEPAGGVEDVHFHPAEGRSARLVLRWGL